MRISVIGLGKLGSPLAAVMARAGHTVVGADTDARPVTALNAGAAPVQEPGLQELIDGAEGRLTATTSIADAVRTTDISFIVVPTPSGPDGTFSNDFVIAAVNTIGQALRSVERHRHLVVVTSTVMPGATGGPIRAALEAASGLVVAESIGLCYHPEFIALGSVVHDIRNTDLILLGESDPQSGEVLGEVLASLVEGSPPVLRMNLVDAELAKLAVNTFVTTKISYANMLSELCDALPGASVDVVTRAVGLDSRIGAKYLRAATPYGGPCFPRDNIALGRLAECLGTTADIAMATQDINLRQVTRLTNLVVRGLAPGDVVAVLGLAYKPGTPVVEESAGILVAKELLRRGFTVTVHDPMAMDNARVALGEGVRFAPTGRDCLQGARACLIMTAWAEYADLHAADLEPRDQPLLVVDCWGLLDGTLISRWADVVRPGVPGVG